MTTDTYITKLGTRFKFGFDQKKELGAENFAIIILEQPDYGGRPDDLSTTRREREGENYIISYSGPIPTLADAKMVAACYADITEKYIKEGQPFPEHPTNENPI